MLTRLRVKGFKNLREVDLAFGPFTCIAGRNGVGKSNVFDAIALLSDLASSPLVAAATQARGTEGRIAGIESLFSRPAQAHGPRIEFVVDMVVPGEVTDDYDRKASPSATYLEYSLELRYDPARASAGREPLYIERESLLAKASSRAADDLKFGPSKAWRKLHLRGPGKRKGAFIDTVPTVKGEPSIELHGEGIGGRPAPVPARYAPQTVLSGVNTSSYPTVLAARREMQSWRQLQLEPTALRMPDEFREASALSPTGRHLPNTVLRCRSGDEVALRLSELIPGIRTVRVDADEKRQIHTLEVCMRDRQTYAASALSDGTLRFLALAVLASDATSGGVICLEEPENGIHPSRIPQMMALVRSLADQPDEDGQAVYSSTGAGPLRQVIINTHSPLVVAELTNAELLLAESQRFRGGEWVGFRPIAGSWRAAGLPITRLVSRGELASYLDAQKIAARRRAATPGSSTLGSKWEQMTLETSLPP